MKTVNDKLRPKFQIQKTCFLLFLATAFFHKSCIDDTRYHHGRENSNAIKSTLFCNYPEQKILQCSSNLLPPPGRS